MQYDKQHGVTKVAAAALAASRLVAYDGGYATSAGGAKDCQGVSETEAAQGAALTLVTGYSFPVEAGEQIALHAYVKPGSNGKAVTGTVDDHCGRALSAASGDGKFFEMQIVKHQHPAT